MPETNPYLVDDRFILRNPGLFEKTLLYATIKSFRFYTRMRDRLCPYDEERKARRPDFRKNPDFNKVYTMVADYWEHWLPRLDSNQSFSIHLGLMEELFVSEVQNRRVSNEDAMRLFEEIKIDFDLFQFQDGVLDRLAEDDRVLTWLDHRAAEGITRLASNMMDLRPITLDQLENQIRLAKTALAPTKGQITRVNDIMDGGMPSMTPVATDLEGINSVTAGGLRMGTTTLVAGINGGGKTILAMQWGVHFAKLGLDVVVFTTEQPPNQLMLRAISNYLSVDYDRLVNRKDVITQQIGMSHKQALRQTSTNSFLPADICQQFEKPLASFREFIHPRLYFVDWSTLTASVYADFESAMAKLEAAGVDPDVVIFDWIGGGIENERNLGGVKLDRRLLYKEAIEGLIKHGTRKKRMMIAFAQVDKMRVKEETKFVTMNMLAECKSMTDNVTNFIGISALRKKDKDEDSSRVQLRLMLHQFLNVDKARFGSGGLVPVDAYFKFQQFKDTYSMASKTTGQSETMTTWAK